METPFTALVVWVIAALVLFLLLFLFIGILLRHEVTRVVVLGVVVLGFCVWHQTPLTENITFYSAILVAYILLFCFAVWAADGGVFGGDTSPYDSVTGCVVEDRKGKIKKNCP